MRFPIGTKVNVFEREGFETITGKITKYQGNFVYVKWKHCGGNGVLKIPNPKVDINFTAKGNDLHQYETSDKA